MTEHKKSQFIYRVTSSLTKSVWEIGVTELPYTEGAKIYSINGGARRLYKEDLLKPDTKLRTDIYSVFSYSVYCFEEDISLAKEIVREAVLNAFHEVRKTVEAIGLAKDSGLKEKPMKRWVEPPPSGEVDLDAIAM